MKNAVSAISHFHIPAGQNSNRFSNDNFVQFYKVGGLVIAHIRRRSPLLENRSSGCCCKKYGT